MSFIYRLFYYSPALDKIYFHPLRKWCYGAILMWGDSMACFLKKTKTKDRIYLQIYESFYDPKKNGTAHRSIKPLGYTDNLKAKGIDDPIQYFQNEVDKLNEERKASSVKLISDISPERFLGYFPLKSILESLNIEPLVNLFRYSTDFQFDLYDVLSSLIFARSVNPCSKFKTFHEVLPSLFQEHSFSYDQLMQALCFFGNDYEKFIDMFNDQVSKKYVIHTDITYFDCTNFYFEIDREDSFRKKGPSKENRRDPIVGLGLLLDANQIPIGMKMYPGNESEKPVLRNIVNELKEKNHIQGKTIQVADKGLNCAKNIYSAKENGDGYLFSKSVKQLPETEKTWVLLKNGYSEIKDKNGITLYWWKECVDKFPYDYTDDKGKKHRFELTEKRVVTFNPSLAKKKKYEINKMVEKAKGLSAAMAKRSEYGESAKYVSFKSTSKGKTTDDKVKAVIDEEAIENDLQLAGYNLLVTSETKANAKDIYSTYHNLWRIEESFRIMKTDLDARPVFVQKEDSIKGHFLICYLTVLLERIFQFKVLKNQYSSSEIFKFLKDFKVVDTNGKYINVSVSTPFLKDLAKSTGLPLDHYSLTSRQINKVLNHKF